MECFYFRLTLPLLKVIALPGMADTCLIERNERSLMSHKEAFFISSASCILIGTRPQSCWVPKSCICNSLGSCTDKAKAVVSEASEQQHLICSLLALVQRKIPRITAPECAHVALRACAWAGGKVPGVEKRRAALLSKVFTAQSSTYLVKQLLCARHGPALGSLGSLKKKNQKC